MMITPSQSLPPAAGQRSQRAPLTESDPASAPFASRVLPGSQGTTDPTSDVVDLVRALARSEARRLHRRERGFGLLGTALVMIVAAALLAVIMLALRGRLALPW